MKGSTNNDPVTGNNDPGDDPSQEGREADLRRLRGVLGEVVLLPLGKKKGCYLKDWTKLTVKSSSRYNSYLMKSTMVGVLLGRASGDLITIDCDNDEFMDALVSANPWLRETFFSKAERAGNFWLRMEGDYPDREVKLKAGGEHVGEWRANGCQTAVIGKHPSGCPYSNNANEPMLVPFSRIVWPDMHESPPIIKEPSVKDTQPSPNGDKKEEVSSTPYPITSYILPITSYPLHNTSKLEEEDSESVANSKEIELSGDKSNANGKGDGCDSITKLHEIFVAEKFPTPRPSRRNARLTEIMPYLHKNVSQDVGMQIVAHDYNLYSSIFNDSRQSHMREAMRLWEGAEAEYPDELCQDGREIYDLLKGRRRDVFRACRSLALFTESQSCKKPKFFLSADHLAERVGCRSIQGWRFLKTLKKENAIKTEKPGVRREKGVKGRATYYRWLLK